MQLPISTWEPIYEGPPTHVGLGPKKRHSQSTENNYGRTTMYHMLTLGASKCMHVVHSVGFAIVVGFGWFYLMRLTHAKP